CYGDFVAQPIGNLNQNVTVTKSSGITDNNQLALLRAAGLKEYINKDLTTLQQMDAEYIYNIKIAEQAGGEYRRITIEFKFLNVF
ncbi:MAG: WD40 repeat domain-containing protein, partial [Alistipes sp.]|nr:WD40 repeat domain-containing protein [Alistipes sp.]